MKWTNKHTLQIWGFEETKNGQQHGAPRIRVFQVLSLKRTHTWPCFQPPQSQTRSNWIRICSNCNPRAILNIAMEMKKKSMCSMVKIIELGHLFHKKNQPALSRMFMRDLRQPHGVGGWDRVNYRETKRFIRSCKCPIPPRPPMLNRGFHPWLRKIADWMYTLWFWQTQLGKSQFSICLVCNLANHHKSSN